MCPHSILLLFLHWPSVPTASGKARVKPAPFPPPPGEGAFLSWEPQRKKKGCSSPTHPPDNSWVQTRWGEREEKSNGKWQPCTGLVDESPCSGRNAGESSPRPQPAQMNELNKRGSGGGELVRAVLAIQEANTGPRTQAWLHCPLHPTLVLSIQAPHRLTLRALQDSAPILHPPQAPTSHSLRSCSFRLGPDASLFLPTTLSTALTSLGPDAPGDAPENELAESGPWRCRGVRSPPALGLRGSGCPGSPRERRRGAGLSRILSGDAGNWQADERARVGGGGSRGQESRNGGTRRSADSGNGWALRRDPGHRTPPRSPHPLRFMYPSTERRRAAGRRNSRRSAGSTSLTSATRGK